MNAFSQCDVVYSLFNSTANCAYIIIILTLLKLKTLYDFHSNVCDVGVHWTCYRWTGDLLFCARDLSMFSTTSLKSTSDNPSLIFYDEMWTGTANHTLQYYWSCNEVIYSTGKSRLNFSLRNLMLTVAGAQLSIETISMISALRNEKMEI